GSTCVSSRSLSGSRFAASGRIGRPRSESPRPLNSTCTTIAVSSDPEVGYSDGRPFRTPAATLGVPRPGRRLGHREVLPVSMHDVAIVGGGPGGLYLSFLLARQGFDVIVLEEHETTGEPVHCTGVLAAEAYDHFELPREAVLNSLSTAQFF